MTLVSDNLPRVLRCEHCGVECDLDADGRPCWGQVECVDEDYADDPDLATWVHACEGHRDVGKYRLPVRQ